VGKADWGRCRISDFIGLAQSALDSVFPELLQEDRLSSEVTWRKFSSSAYNPDAGYNEDRYEVFVMRAIKIDRVLGVGGGTGYPMGVEGAQLAEGQVIFLFDPADVPEGASIRDTIVDGVTQYKIKTIYPVYGLITKVLAQGIGSATET